MMTCLPSSHCLLVSSKASCISRRVNTDDPQITIRFHPEESIINYKYLESKREPISKPTECSGLATQSVHSISGSPLWSSGWLAAVASTVTYCHCHFPALQKSIVLNIPSPGKEQNSCWELRFLLNANSLLDHHKAKESLSQICH